MQRFFVEEHQIDRQGGSIRITGTDVNHIRNVLRMKPGDDVFISGGQREEFICRIDAIGEEQVDLEILEIRQGDYELPSRIVLFQGLPKGDKMELIIQKAVELGAAAVVPVAMKRCVTRLDEKKAEKKVQRWQQIAESAAKQSKRMEIPRVYPVMSYQKALEMAADLDKAFLPYEHAAGMEQTREQIRAVKPGESIGILIGPEGGYEEEEVQAAVERGIRPVTLGKRILRTETAGMMLLSVLMFQLEGDA